MPLFISAMNDGVFKQKSRGERAETNKRQTACEIIRTVNYLVNHMINGTWTLLVTSRRGFHSRTRPLHAVPKGITDTGSHHISRGVRPSMCLRTVQFGSVRFGSALDLNWGWETWWQRGNGGAEQGADVGHSFTLFKCQITFVPGMPCAAWSRRHCCIICLINCTADGARSRVMCQANANGDTLLPTCHPLHTHPSCPSGH